ncbi:ceramidase domain-containing protein [Patescibacteria group bacterium]|nr:ceramidase domain-containing protein [Patescibacteria group bacterium]
MSSIGPIYCETPVGAFLFPAEPINFYSNAIIVLFGLVALAYAVKRRFSADISVLALLLALTGVGSFLWHGFRTPLSLALDVVPGLLFLFLFVYAWSRRVYGVLASLGLLVGFLGLTYALSFVSESVLPMQGPPLGVVLAVLISAGYLSVLSIQRFGSVGYVAILSVISSLIAFGFRTLDLYTCTVIPFGTHFLWHVFLSLGAALGVLFLMLVDSSRKL